MKYIIEISEKPIIDEMGKFIKEGEGKYLNDFHGVLYIFSLDDPESYLKMQDFYNGQVAAESLFKPRVAVANKLDMIAEEDYEGMVDLSKSNILGEDENLNINGTRKWVDKIMNCDYAEISGKDPSNVDEVFCMLISLIDDREEEKTKTDT